MALTMATHFLPVSVSKEGHLVVVFPKGRTGDAEQLHALAQRYPIEDADYATVNLAGVIGGECPFWQGG